MTHTERLALIYLPFPVVHVCGSAKSWTGATIREVWDHREGSILKKSVEGGQDYNYWSTTDDTTYGG